MSKQALTSDGDLRPLGIISDGMFIREDLTNDGVFIDNVESDGDFLEEEPTSDGFFLGFGFGLDWLQFYLLEAPEGIDMDIITLDTFGELSEPILVPEEPISSEGRLLDGVLSDGEFLDE